MYGPGVTDAEIKIGQTVPYSGPASAFSSYGRVMIGYFQDPAWAQDPEVIEYIAFMKKWAPTDSPNDFIALSGYVNAQAIARGLQRCGDNLTPENLLAQATSFNKERVGMLLPGIELTNSNENYAPYRSLRMAIFEKTSWKLLEESSDTKARW
jgi:hypothetical protein